MATFTILFCAFYLLRLMRRRPCLATLFASCRLLSLLLLLLSIKSLSAAFASLGATILLLFGPILLLVSKGGGGGMTRPHSVGRKM